jgi:hypothetical protein
MPFYALRASTIGFALWVLVIGGYWVIASIGVWRSASSYPSQKVADVQVLTSGWRGRHFWAVAAKVVVVIFAARVLWWLVKGGALGLMQRLTGPLNY